MTDKEYKQQKERVRKLIKRWVRPLGLNWWKIDFVYERSEKTQDDTDYSPKAIKGKWTCALDTSCDPYYLTAEIRAFLPILQDINDEDLEEYFVHELMHVFLSPMHSKKTAKEEEQVATKLAQAFIWSRDSEKPKKRSQ